MHRLAISDWNQDGADDIITVVESTKTVWAISPLTEQTLTYQSDEDIRSFVASGDFNGDQTLDVTFGSAVDNALLFTSIPGVAKVVLEEDSPIQSYDLSNISAGGDESQALRVTATSNNTTVIPDPYGHLHQRGCNRLNHIYTSCGSIRRGHHHRHR